MVSCSRINISICTHVYTVFNMLIYFNMEVDNVFIYFSTEVDDMLIYFSMEVDNILIYFSTEVDEKLIEMLMNLVFQMLCDGELTLARVLRSKVLEKCLYLQKLRESHQQAALWPQHKLLTKSVHLSAFLNCNLYCSRCQNDIIC